MTHIATERTSGFPRETSLTLTTARISSRFVRRAALRTAAGLSLAYILLPMVFVIWLAFFRQEIPSFPPEVLCRQGRAYVFKDG